MPHLALYQPDIPQNVGAAMRLCACLDVDLHIIEPCGFPWNERKIRQSGMDYMEHVQLRRHAGWEAFSAARKGRLLLLTAHGDTPYWNIKFRSDDILLAGRESAGVPETIHEAADARLLIPMTPPARSLNIVNACAITLGEMKRQMNE